MSNSKSHQAYVARRDLRLRSDKTAAAIMAFALGYVDKHRTEGLTEAGTFAEAARFAVQAADALLARLDATRPELTAPMTHEEMVEETGERR
jgi:hypothetical protein